MFVREVREAAAGDVEDDGGEGAAGGGAEEWLGWARVGGGFADGGDVFAVPDFAGRGSEDGGAVGWVENVVRPLYDAVFV